MYGGYEHKSGDVTAVVCMVDSAKKRKEKQADRKSDREPYPIEQHADWLREVQYGSDRSIAIISGANLEAWLSLLICHKLKNGDDDTLDRLHASEGPLSDFHRKIELAYAMGLIGETDRVELGKIRKIRNKFAHKTSLITFESDIIRKDCFELRIRGEPADNAGDILSGKVVVEGAAKSLFLFTVEDYIVELANKASASLRDKLIGMEDKMKQLGTPIPELPLSLRPK